MSKRTLAILIALFLWQGAARASAQCADWLAGPLDNGSAPNGADDVIVTALSWDPDDAGPLSPRLVVGGSFTSIGGVSAYHIAQRDPASGLWSPMGAGLGGTVNALAIYNGQLVAGSSGDNNVGTFDSTVNQWDGAAWHALSATNTGSVRALAVYNGELYIGGNFMTQFTTTVTAYFLARWNPAAHLWDNMNNPFGSQTNTAVYALAVYNNDLYAGGYSHAAVGSAADLAHWNAGSGWIHETTGSDQGGIYALATFAGELIVGGGFLTLNGVTYNNIAGWNGAAFHGFSSGTGGTPFGGTIYSIDIYQGIVIGGVFTNASGLPANHVALWPAGGFAWQALGGGTNDTVRDLLPYNNQLVAVGDFSIADLPANHIAHWDGSQWGSFGGGTGSYVLALTAFNGRMVAGGEFHQSTGGMSTAHNIAGWSGGTPQAFGVGMNGAVWALKAFSTGFVGGTDLVAGGTFTQAGGVATNYIARWHESFVAFPPPAWAAMGPGFNNAVYTIERFSGSTYAGGAFTLSGGTGVNRIARYNTSTSQWEPLGSGMNGYVYALKEYNGYLYAGGNFTTAGGVSTGGLARWNGASWSQCGGFFNGAVLSLAVYNGRLAIGGQYPGINNSPNLAEYDGTFYYTYSTGGANNNVRAMVADGSRLYVAGDFSSIGGVPVNRIGYWDGAWHALPNGTNDIIYTLAMYGGEVQVGGQFSLDNYGGAALTSPFWGRYSGGGALWFATQPLSQTIPFGGNAFFTAQPASGLTVESYQWFHDDVPLSDGSTASGATIGGATTPMLAVTGAGWSEAGGYRLEISDACDTVTTWAAPLSFSGTTAAPGPQIMATALRSLGPNPASGPARLEFSLAREGAVRFLVHDLRGRLVRRLDVGDLPEGLHEARWDAADERGKRVAAGLYLVRFEVDGRAVDSRRLMIVR